MPNQIENITQPEKPLPAGWEMRCDVYGRRYYVDHNTRSTSWERRKTSSVTSRGSKSRYARQNILCSPQ